MAAAWLCLLGCSLVVDSSDVDQGCSSKQKICDGRCVERNDEAYGCTDTGCDPCRLTNAIPQCSDSGECVVLACLQGFECADEKTGCFVNILVDSANCGVCGKRCSPGRSCSNGECVEDPAG